MSAVLFMGVGVPSCFEVWFLWMNSVPQCGKIGLVWGAGEVGNVYEYRRGSCRGALSFTVTTPHECVR